MSSFSSTYPSQRPVFSLDASNAGRLDPRCSFTRASTANVFDGAKHLSSENLLLQSSDFDNASWNTTGINGTPTGGQADPSGGTDGFTLVEDSDPNFHRLWQGVTASGDFAFTVYAKQNSGTRYLSLTLYNASADWVGATFDLAGSAPATGSGSSSSFSGLTATQTPSGGGYYKCTIKATGSVTSAQAVLNNVTSAPTGGYGLPSYAGDGTSSIDVAFASLSTTGATDYNATTTQIHREYAPSLVSKANNVGRFDHTTDGQSAGTSLGILVEGQSTNLQRYGSSVSNWSDSSTVAVTSDAGVSPSGTLTADLLVSPASAGAHYVLDASIAFASSTTYTASIYVKSAGHQYIQLCGNSSAFGSGKFANFDLVNGTTSATNATSTIDAVGNGWYRVSLTAEATTAVTSSVIVMFADSLSDGFFPTTTGDAYSGFLVWGYQIETGSFASSLTDTGTGSSQLTRASESLSVATADIGLTAGQDVTLYAEGDYGDPSILANNRVAVALQASSNSYVSLYNPSGNAASAYVLDGGNDQAFFPSGVTAGAFKAAISAQNNSFKYAANGTSSTEDTAGTVPKYTDLRFGCFSTTGVELNGTLKRVAVYGQSLSSSELAAITS